MEKGGQMENERAEKWQGGQSVMKLEGLKKSYCVL